MTSTLSPEHQQLVYMLFAREVGPLVKTKYPNIEKMQFNQILGRIWSELPPVEKNKYILKADFQRKMEMGARAPAPMPMPAPGLLRQSPSPPMLGRPPLGPVPVMRPFDRYAAQTKMTLVKQYPYLGPREIEQLVMRMWSQLSDAEKARYNDMNVMRSLQQQQYPGQPPQMIVMRKGPAPAQQHLQMPPATPQMMTPPPAAPLPLDELNKVKVNVTEKTENIFMREDDSEDEEEDEEGTLSEGCEIKKIPFAALTADDKNPVDSKSNEIKAEEDVKHPGIASQEEAIGEGGKDTDKDSIAESDTDDEEGKEEINSKTKTEASPPPTLKIIPAALESKISGAREDDENPDDPEGVEMPDEDDVPSDEESDEDSESGDDEEDEGEKLTDPLEEDTETKSSKNKVPPVDDLSPPPKSIKVEEQPGKTVVLSNPEKSTQKCNTCKVLVDEVKKRGEMIEKLKQKIKWMEAEMDKKSPSLDEDGLEVAG